MAPPIALGAQALANAPQKEFTAVPLLAVHQGQGLQLCHKGLGRAVGSPPPLLEDRAQQLLPRALRKCVAALGGVQRVHPLLLHTKRSRQQTSAPQICRLPLHLQFTFPRSRLAKRNRVRIYVRVCVRICGGRLCAYVAWNPHSYFGTVVIIGATVAVVLALVTAL